MSMATGGSSVGSLSMASETVFNIAHEHEVVALLRRVHVSPLSLDVKNYLRDLIFSTRFEPQVPVDPAMVSAFATHGLTVVYEPATPVKENSVPTVSVVTAPVESVVAPAPVPSTFGRARVTPAFVSSPTTVEPTEVTPVAEPGSAPEETVVPAPVAAEPAVLNEEETTLPEITPVTPLPEVSDVVVEDSVSAPLPVDEVVPVEVTPVVEPLPESVAPQVATPDFSVVEPLPSAEPVVPLPEPAVMPEATPDFTPATSAPEPVVVPPAAMVVEPAVVPEMPAPEPVSVPEEVPTVAGSDPSARIAEIKRDINARVGNPVNLIDAHNEVGREYMNALLDAMKKMAVGTGQQEIDRAMARLERAYTAVVSALETQASTVETVTEVEETAQETAASVGTPPEQATSGWASARTDSALAVESQTEVPLQTAETPTVSQEVPSVFPMESVGATAEAASAGITSVAKEKQLKELMEARTAAMEASEAERMEQVRRDPLMADDVTSGLNQLLAEWKLFKSSGIFGTGPSGHEHPLYKKIAGLTMAAVLAGRYEGASAENKTSISDYMNGWRYEEGITHEPGETFENYLRRVIRHILDKQVPSV